MSLVELCVSSAILLALLGALAMVMRVVMDYHRRTDDQITLERSTLLTLKRIGREVSESAWPSIVLAAEGLVFASPRDSSGNFLVGSGDQPAWSGLFCYARESGDRLVKRVETFASPNPLIPEPLTLAPPRDVAWFASSGLPVRVVQTGVELFEVSREAVGQEDGEAVLHIAIRAGVGEPGPRRYWLRLDTSVRPRN